MSEYNIQWWRKDYSVSYMSASYDLIVLLLLWKYCFTSSRCIFFKKLSVGLHNNKGLQFTCQSPEPLSSDSSVPGGGWTAHHCMWDTSLHKLSVFDPYCAQSLTCFSNNLTRNLISPPDTFCTYFLHYQLFSIRWQTSQSFQNCLLKKQLLKTWD